LFDSGQLRANNPESLLRTVWFYNTTNVGMRGVTEHHAMLGYIHLIADSNGVKYGIF